MTQNEKTANNIKEIKYFVKYLENNYKAHTRNLKETTNFDDMENSIAFLKDYAEVSEALLKIINKYLEGYGLSY